MPIHRTGKHSSQVRIYRGIVRGTRTFVYSTARRDEKDVENEKRPGLGADWQDHSLVFCANGRRPMSGDNLRRRDLQRILKAARLPLTIQHLRCQAHPRDSARQEGHPAQRYSRATRPLRHRHHHGSMCPRSGGRPRCRLRCDRHQSIPRLRKHGQNREKTKRPSLGARTLVCMLCASLRICGSAFCHAL